jgi:WD40 repeat protein
MLATGSLDTTIKLWDPATGAQRLTLSGHKKDVTSLAFSPDGKLLASASQDATVRLWDVSRSALVKTIPTEGNMLYGVAFSPDSAVIVAAGHKGVTAWNVADGTTAGTLGDWKLGHKAAAFSPAGKHVASGGDDRLVRLGGLTGDPAALKGHRSTVLTVAFGPFGRMLASGGKDNVVRLWNVELEAETRALEGHSQGVTCVAFSSDGQLLASGSEDKTIKLWSLK